MSSLHHLTTLILKKRIKSYHKRIEFVSHSPTITCLGLAQPPGKPVMVTYK